MYVHVYMPAGYFMGGRQPSKEVSGMWLCSGEEWRLQQNELHSVWNMLLLAVWSEDRRVRECMEMKGNGEEEVDGNEGVLSWYCNPLGMAILTLTPSAACSGTRTTNLRKTRATSPRSATSMTLVCWKYSCILSAQSVK